MNVGQSGAVIEPFLVSGGQSWFWDFDLGNAAAAGVQLVCSVYVPKGKIGFVKQLRCAPFMPSVLAAPWNTSGAAGGAATWPSFNTAGDERPIRPPGQNGVWTTPLGWQSYVAWTPNGVHFPLQPNFVPTWTWSLRLLQGGIDSLRAQGDNLPPPNDGFISQNVDGLSTETSQQLFLQEGVAVPLAVYPGGLLPGTAPGPAFADQPVQVLQGDELDLHVMIPEDTSAVLFTKWQQAQTTPIAYDAGGRIVYGDPVYPLLPSFGQLAGYMQNAVSPAALANAQQGWGG